MSWCQKEKSEPQEAHTICIDQRVFLEYKVLNSVHSSDHPGHQGSPKFPCTFNEWDSKEQKSLMRQ